MDNETFALIVISSPVWLSVLVAVCSVTVSSIMAFEKRLNLYDNSGKPAGLVYIDSYIGSNKIKFSVGPNMDVYTEFLSILEQNFPRDVPWNAVRNAVKAGESNDYPHYIAGKKEAELYLDDEGVYTFSFSKTSNFLTLFTHMKLRRQIERLFKEVVINKKDVHSNIEEKIVTIPENSGLESYVFSLKDSDDTKLKEQLLKLCKNMEHTMGMDYRNNNNVRQVFNVHVSTLSDMLDIYAELPRSREREESRAEIIEVIGLLTETLTDFHQGHQSGNKKNISGMAKKIKSMLEAGNQHTL